MNISNTRRVDMTDVSEWGIASVLVAVSMGEHVRRNLVLHLITCDHTCFLWPPKM